MHDPMREYRTAACKLYTARRLFFKAPGLVQRLRLYREYRRFSAVWDATKDFDLKTK